MKCVANMTLSALRGAGAAALPGYEALLISAFDAEAAPYGAHWYGEEYRSRARDPMWFLQSLLANARKEAEGARQLWSIASHTLDSGVADQIRQHAVDEARHARYYLQMARLTFPDAAADHEWRTLTDTVPTFTRRAQFVPTTPLDPAITLDELIQTNIGEIRTRIHQQLLRAVIVAHCPPTSRPRLEKLVDAILLDETRHVAYTAARIEHYLDSGQSRLVREIMFERLREFNALTLTEVGAATFDGACGEATADGFRSA